MSKAWNRVGDWRVVDDNDGHTFIIPYDSEEQFALWVEQQEGDRDDYKGPAFDEFMLQSHISMYRFSGIVTRYIPAPEPVPKSEDKTDE